MADLPPLSDLAIIFGGPSPEHDVSILTGLQVARELSDDQPGSGSGRVRALYWSKVGDWFEVDAGLEASAFADGVPRRAERLRLLAAPGGGFVRDRGRFGRPGAVAIGAAVVCCHGGPGEDGTLQAVLDLADIAYTGPTAAGAAIGIDKLAFGAVATGAGLPGLRREAVRTDTAELGFGGPFIVKPRFGGSSIGVEVVEDLLAARSLLSSSSHLGNGAVIEPYRRDCFDLQIAVRSWPQVELSAIERPVRGAQLAGTSGEPEILGYADKYQGGEGMASAPRELPADVSEKVADEVRRVALAVADLVSLRGVARIDFLSDGTEVFVNEINTIPGSLARYLWIDPIVSFRELLDALIQEARSRPTHQYGTAGADGSVLRGAASIAAKLA